MPAQIEKKDNNTVVLTFEASQEEFSEAIQKSFIKNKNRFQIPGFRKGKAPIQMVKKYYGEGVFYDDAIDFIVNDAYPKAIEEHKLEVVSRPELDILDIGSGKGMKYTLTVTVKPEVKLGKYEGVEAEYVYEEPGQEAVDQEIERVVERSSRMIPVDDRAVQKDDTVTIDYEGFVDGIAFEGGKAEAYDLKIGSNSFIPGFEEQLIGHRVGEEFPITVTFPEDYQSEDLKGKEATFQIKLHAIKVKELPDVDDEFVQDVSEFDTLDEYCADILKTKIEQAKEQAEAAFQNAVVKAVCDNAEVEVPQCMIDTEVEEMTREQGMRMQQQGIELEQYLQFVGQTMDDFKKTMEPMAKQRVESNLVIEEAAKALKVEVTQEDIDEELEKIATQYGMKKEDLAQRIAGNDGFIRDVIMGKKTVELLAEKAKKVDAAKEDKKEKKTKTTKTSSAKKTTGKKDTDKKATTKKATTKKPAAKKKDEEEKE